MNNKRTQTENENTLLQCSFDLEVRFIITFSVVLLVLFFLTFMLQSEITFETFIIDLLSYGLIYVCAIIIPNFLIKRKQLYITNQRIETIFDLGSFYYNAKDYRFDTIHNVYISKNILGLNTIVVMFDNGQSIFNQSFFSHSFKKLVIRHVEDVDACYASLISIALQTKNNIDYFGDLIDKKEKSSSAKNTNL